MIASFCHLADPSDVSGIWVCAYRKRWNARCAAYKARCDARDPADQLLRDIEFDRRVRGVLAKSPPLFAAERPR